MGRGQTRQRAEMKSGTEERPGALELYWVQFAILKFTFRWDREKKAKSNHGARLLGGAADARAKAELGTSCPGTKGGGDWKR